MAEKLAIDLTGSLLGFTTPDRLFGALSASALVIPLVVLVPALLEELGWRGFGVQAALDDGRSPAWAALVVGLIFVMLHVPLYLRGQLYEGLPVWPLPLILLSSSVLLTWIYVRTSSVLLAGLMHAAFNATVPLTWGLDPAWVWSARGIALPLIAIAVVVWSVARARARRGQRIQTRSGPMPAKPTTTRLRGRRRTHSPRGRVPGTPGPRRRSGPTTP